MFKTCRRLALFLLLFPALLWAIPPSVVFTGVATTLDTGTALLNHPAGLAVDAFGNVYIADTAHNQIVKVTSAGSASVLTISGLGVGLSAPEAMALDSAGNLYIADTGNNRVVVITPSGSGSVVDLGGLTLLAPGGVAIDASDNLYISDSDNDRIIKKPSGGSAAVLSITGLGSLLDDPAGLAVDVAGNLYIADTGNNRIVKVITSGSGSAVGISGLGTPLSAPTGVAVDPSGNLVIADSGNNRVVAVKTGAGSVSGTGTLTLNTPRALAVDPMGVVCVADTVNSRVVVLMMSAVSYGQVQVGASSGRSLTLPFTVSVATTLGSVQALLLGSQSLDFTLGAGTTCTNGTTNTTCNVEVQFLPLAAGLRRGAVALFDQSSTLLAIVPIFGTGGAPLAALSPGVASIVSTGGVSTSYPFGVVTDGAGNIYVGNYMGNNVVKIAAGGGSASVISTGALTLNEAAGVVVDGAGTLYIADYGHNRIVRVDSTGTAAILTITGLATAINQPAGMVMDAAGNLYIADWGNSRIVRVTTAGEGQVVATGSYTLNQYGVTGVAVDASQNIYIADRYGNHIVKVAPSGAASLVTVTGLSLSNPQGVAVDGNGNLFIADSGHNRIIRLTTSGEASVVPTPGLTFGSSVFGLTTDAGGNIFVADWSNNRIVKVSAASAVLTFANTVVGATSSDSPKTATVTNVGTQALVFSADPSYTSDFTENSSGTNLCASEMSLDPGESCNVSVRFIPQSAASLSTNIVVTNNHLNGSPATQNVAVSGTGLSPITPTISWTEPSAITYGTDLTGVLIAAARNGASAVDGTYAYTATPQGGSATSVTSSTILEAGIYAVSVTFTPSSVSYTTATGGVSLTVDKGTPTVTVATSTNPVLASDSITFTATVSSSVSTPGGSVNFYDGATLLGSGTLSAGTATYVTSTLASGTHSVTAAYQGDSNFLSATSPAVSQVVQDFDWSVPTGGSRSAVVSAGGTATFTLAITPSGGATFPAAVSLAVTGLPPGAVATFTPQSLPSGAGATNVALTIQVPNQTVSARPLHARPYLAFFLPMIGALMLMPGAHGSSRKSGGKRRVWLMLFSAVLICALMALAACGGSGTRPPNPQTYTLTVTATSNSLSHSTTLTLTVQ